MKENNKKHSVGVDVSKKHLDAYAIIDRTFQQFPNTLKGIKKLIQWSIKKSECPFIVFELSGGYERKLENIVQDYHGVLYSNE